MRLFHKGIINEGIFNREDVFLNCNFALSTYHIDLLVVTLFYIFRIINIHANYFIF